MSGIEFLPGDAPTQRYRPPPPTVPPALPREPAPPEAAHQPPRRRFGPQSLTSRITVGVVGLVVVLVLVVAMGTDYALRSFLSSRLDQQLQTTAESANSLFHARQDAPSPQQVWAVALDPTSGAPLSYASGPSVLPLHLSAARRRKIASRDTFAPLTVETTDGLNLRVTTRPGNVQFSSVDVQLATVVIGLSTNDEHNTLRRLIELELLIGGAAVLVAILATAYGVRFSLRRLHQVTDTAQDVAAELSPEGAGLDRRVPDDEPGTEVGKLATSFNTLLAAVETQFAARLESEQRMRQFLADASHELRTPLTSIRGYAELARMQRVTAGGGHSPDNLDRIESEGTRMSRLVDDLLLLARGDADASSRAAERVPVDLGDVVDEAVSGSRAAFPDRPVSVQLADVPAVLGDRDQLLRVVRNLVTNAAVHTEAGRPISVRAVAEAGGTTVQVIDGGPGLPAEQAAHVFERFWRADKARTRARGGSGLGLSIVAAIVRSHGGAVRFDSSTDAGSTVTLWLPGAAR